MLQEVIPSYPNVHGTLLLGIIQFFADRGASDSASRRLGIYYQALITSSPDMPQPGIQKVGDPGKGGHPMLSECVRQDPTSWDVSINFCLIRDEPTHFIQRIPDRISILAAS